MPEAKTFLLSEIEEGFNVPIKKIVEHLSSKGYTVENNPNSKIGSAEYNILYDEFYAQKKWKNTDERFVVYLDIMGFKDFVSRNKHEAVHGTLEKVLGFIKDAEGFSNTGFTTDENGKKTQFETIHITMFSDSIFLFSKDNTRLSFAMITIAAYTLFVDAITNCIPMKGAMACGLISVDREQHIYCGQPLIDAHLLQEDVNYYGVVAHHSIDKFFLDNEVDEFHRNCFKDFKTPLKSGNIVHRNLNWFAALDFWGMFRQDIPKKEFEKEIEKLKAITSGAPRKYIDNTIDAFNSIYYPKPSS